MWEDLYVLAIKVCIFKKRKRKLSNEIRKKTLWMRLDNADVTPKCQWIKATLQGKLSEGYKETLGIVLVTSYKSMKMKVLVAQSYLTPCVALPGSSVHGILQARILEWEAIPLFRGSSRLRDQTRVSYIAGRFFTIWATRETRKSTVTAIWKEQINKQTREWGDTEQHISFLAHAACLGRLAVLCSLTHQQAEGGSSSVTPGSRMHNLNNLWWSASWLLKFPPWRGTQHFCFIGQRKSHSHI